MGDVFTLVTYVRHFLMSNKSEPFGPMHQYHVSAFYAKVIRRMEAFPSFNHLKLVEILKVMMEENLLMNIGFDKPVWNQFAIAYMQMIDDKVTDDEIRKLFGNLSGKSPEMQIMTFRTLWLHTYLHYDETHKFLAVQLLN